MKTVTVNTFLSTRKVCYSEEKIRGIAGDKREWTALDVLALENVPAKDRLYAVLDESFIDAPILNEAVCRFAERVLARIENPDPRSVDGIAMNRMWVRGEATEDEMLAARAAARAAAWDAEAATEDAARIAARDAAHAAAHAAAGEAAGEAAWDAARDAAHAAAWTAAGEDAGEAAWEAAWDAEREEQVRILIELLREGESEEEWKRS
jgi:hypothetical protein